MSLKYDNCIEGRAYFSRAGPGPGHIIHFAGQARFAPPQIKSVGLGTNFRPVRGPNLYNNDLKRLHSSRIYIAFDTYRDTSMKNVERILRGEGLQLQAISETQLAKTVEEVLAAILQ